MDMAVLDDLVLAALGAPGKTNYDALFDFLDKAGDPIPAEAADSLNTLWEGMISALNPEGAVFCYRVAALPLPESDLFRKLLVGSAAKLLPPYQNKPPVTRAIGIRDDKLKIQEIAARWKKLQQLKSSSVVFLPGSKRWGSIGSIDPLNGTVVIYAFSGLGLNSATPLELVLNEAVVLTPGTEVNKLVSTIGMPDCSAFRAIVKRRAVLPVPESIMREMALAGCARDMSPAAFAVYWQAENPDAPAPAAAPAQNTRSSSRGRSLREINILLGNEAKAGAGQFSADDVKSFEQFFARLSPEIARRETKLLAQDLAGIAARTPEEDLPALIEPLREKATFWPPAPAEASYDELSVWGDISAKDVDVLARATAHGFGEEYLADCAQVFPLKALNSICPRVSPDLLFSVATERRRCSCDLLLWIWKNRKKHNSEKLTSLVNIENVCRALNLPEEPPRIWNASVRELSTALMNNSEFQGFLLRNCPSIEHFAKVLQGATFLGPRERQSLLAKMARNSAELREYLENGAARKLISSDSEVRAPAETTEFTSVRSRQRLQEELDDLVNVQIPENREAIKTARAHGDLSENAEFDAAKERRNYLRRRREELERDLASIQAILMKDVVVEDTAVLGSMVELEFSDNARETYYLLGARDGNPEKKYLSYRSRLGAAILGHAVGETLTVPGDKTCKLCAVRPLPAELIAELDA